MRHRDRMIHLRVTEETHNLLKKLCERERVTAATLIEQMLHDRDENPTQFFAHCAAIQSNAAYILLGTLIRNLYRENDVGLQIIRQATLSSKDLYGETPPPPQHLKQRPGHDRRVAALHRTFFEREAELPT